MAAKVVATPAVAVLAVAVLGEGGPVAVAPVVAVRAAVGEAAGVDTAKPRQIDPQSRSRGHPRLPMRKA